MSPDAIDLPALTERQERVLALIVHEYISKPEPVSSKYLAEHYLTKVSSATIRNEMAVLEQLGLILAPHTSAGRVPTDAGYRYFVKRLLETSELTLEEQRGIIAAFNSVPNDINEWMRLAVSTLARTSHSAALVTSPRAVTSQFKHIELISTQGRLVLMVLVLYGGDVRQQMLTLAETLTQEALSAAARRLNAICDDLTAEQTRAKMWLVDNELDRELLEVIADVLDDVDNKPRGVAFREGLSDVLPEFTESEGAQQALRLLEEHSILAGILAEALDPKIGHVQVVIAGEGRWKEVRHLSMVLSRYGVNGQATGALGVLGPMRMRYGRAISAVRYVAGVMSNLLFEAYGGDSSENPNPPS